jgi:hypothetical protein
VERTEVNETAREVGKERIQFFVNKNRHSHNVAMENLDWVVGTTKGYNKSILKILYCQGHSYIAAASYCAPNAVSPVPKKNMMSLLLHLL